MSNCKWFRGTNSARKGQRGQRAKRAEVGEGKVAFCGFLRFQFRLNLWATRRPPQMKCETEAKDEGRRRRRRTRNLYLIFGRSSNASGCVLTLAFSLSLPLPFLFPFSVPLSPPSCLTCYPFGGLCVWPHGEKPQVMSFSLRSRIATGSRRRSRKKSGRERKGKPK